MVRMTRDLREKSGTGIKMGRKIDIKSKTGRQLQDIMEEEAKMRIMEIGETRILAGCDGIIFLLEFAFVLVVNQ